MKKGIKRICKKFMMILLTSVTMLTAMNFNSVNIHGAENQPVKLYDISGTSAQVTQGMYSAWWADGIGKIQVNGEDAFCIEPTVLDLNGPYTAYNDLPVDLQRDLSRIVYYGWDSTAKTDSDYATTQFMVWERLGASINLTGSFASQYPTLKANVQAKINTHSLVTSFYNGNYTINVGDSLTLNDTNGVLGQFHVADNGGANVSISGNNLIITPNVNTPDDTIIKLQKIRSEYVGSSIAYRTGNGQDVGTFKVSDPITVPINIHTNKFGSLEIAKQDNLGNYVSGVTFAVSRNADMSSPFATVTTGANGKVTEDDILMGDVYVQETAVVEPLTIDRTIHKVTILPNETVTFNQTNQRATGTAILKKVDKDTGGTTPQGEARLDDAVYELRALEDTYDAITGAKILSKDQLMKTETIGSDLTMSVTGLQPARYYFIEKTEATGYLLDNEKHIVDLRYVDDATAVVTKDTTSYQEVKRGNIKLQKFINTAGTGIKLPEPNATFIVQLEKDIKVMGEANAPIYATITTDSLGMAEAKDLPWAGVLGYRVTQTTAMNENLEMAEPFNSKIVNDGETMYYIVGNELHTSYLQVYKYDADLEENITFSATFKIYDVTNDEWYSEVVGNKLIEEWTTDETGMLITNKVLPAGDYRLVETGVPSGYLEPDEDIEFTIKASNAHETNIDGKPIFVVRVSNKAPKGSLTLNKVFERVDGLHDDEVLSSGWKATFVNDVIANYDGETVLYNAGDQFVNPNSADGLWYAEENTPLLIEDIYVGYGDGTTLEFEEVVVPEGYVKADNFTETWKKDETDNTTKVIEISREVENKVSRTDIEVVKTNLYSSEVVKGIFGFEITAYLDEELTEVYDTQLVNPLTGKAVFKDVAYGTTLYFKETATHESYYLSDEVIKVVVDKNLNGIGEVYSFTYVNRPVPTIGTTATGINGLKTLDPTIANEMTDISDVKNIDITKTYTIHVKFWKYDESGNSNHTVVLEDDYNDITFEEADTTFTSKLLAEANTLEEGRYFFTEHFYEDGNDNPEIDTPIVEHNDPEDDGQTLHMEKTEYTINVAKKDSTNNEIIKNKDFTFEATFYKDGKEIVGEKVSGNTETGIATVTFKGQGTYDEVRIKETGAPDGYVLSSEVKVVTMDMFDDENVYTFDYFNDRVPAKAVIKAGDTTNGTFYMQIGLLSLLMMLGVLLAKRHSVEHRCTGHLETTDGGTVETATILLLPVTFVNNIKQGIYK